MRHHRNSGIVLVILASVLLAAAPVAAQEAPLVELGRPGGGSSVFALGPAGWRDGQPPAH